MLELITISKGKSVKKKVENSVNQKTLKEDINTNLQICNFMSGKIFSIQKTTIKIA